MCDVMSFPATVDEFMEQYKIVDREEVYTNGAAMVPIFRMKQWFEHEELKKAPTGLDHIHNVVAEREYQRGYKTAKEEYDHKLTVIKGRIKDNYYNKGYEQGKADANHPENLDSWIPVSEKLPKSNPEDLEYPTVIICLKDGTVELGCFYESTKEWGTGEDFDRIVNPVAWMPLPEPWEGEQHETD